MISKSEARERLLALINPADATNRGTTPEDAVDDAIHEAILNQPAMRHCLVPGCLREFDMASHMTGNPPPRPSWSGNGWSQLGNGTIFPAGGHICPDHKQLVTDHMPRRLQLPGNRWGADCACGWITTPQRWHGAVRALWEQHILTVAGCLPADPPLTDPEHRIPLADQTETTLAELYDRLWDAEADRDETRETARSCMLGYTTAVPALLGVRTSLEALSSRMAVDSRDWTAEKLDAWLWAVLVGANCENTDPEHVHDDIDCNGDQGLWELARRHGIPADETIRTGQLRWWVANAVKVAEQIERTTA